MDLFKAERVINFLLNALQEQNNVLARELFSRLLIRFNDRRDSKLIGLILYLIEPQLLIVDTHFKYPSKNVIQKFGCELFNRLYSNNEDLSETNTSHTTQQPVSIMTLQDRLRNSLDVLEKIKMSSNTEICESLKKDFEYYDKFGKKSPRLQSLLEALLTIPPTSTRAERNFSLAANIVTKQRSKLTDQHVDAIFFLKSFFLTNVE